MLPAIRRHAEVSFRQLDPEACDDAVQETVANCFTAYARLVELDKEELAYPGPLAMHAVAQINVGRRVGSRWSSSDVSSPRCQQLRGVFVDRLDHFDPQEGEWEEIVVEDRRAGPSEIAAMRIDFRQWLGTLSHRDRRLAETLAAGETTQDAARMFRLTAARVSQLRRELHADLVPIPGRAARGSDACRSVCLTMRQVARCRRNRCPLVSRRIWSGTSGHLAAQLSQRTATHVSIARRLWGS